MIDSSCGALLDASTARRRDTSRGIAALRTLIANEILGNTANTNAVALDMPRSAYLPELLDEYALRLFCEWLLYRWESELYRLDVKPDNIGLAESIVSILESTGHYPFADSSHIRIEQKFRNQLYAWLDRTFVPACELLGSLYEELVATPWAAPDDNGSLPSGHIQERNKRRSTGQFFTPPNIVRCCYERFFEIDSNSFMSNRQETVNPAPLALLEQDTAVRLSSASILDPSCGTGNFLIGAVKLLEGTAVDLRQFAECNLFGAEMDGRAAAVARVAILVQTLRSTVAAGVGRDVVIESARRLFNALRKHIAVTDSLFADLNGLFGRQDGFDLVITNPPYISFGARNQPELSGCQQRLLKALYPDAAEYKVRLHSIFQEIAIKHAKAGASAVLFVPDSFLSGSYYRKLRQAIVSQSDIVSLTELPTDTISGAVVGRWCIAHYRRKVPASTPVAINLLQASRDGEIANRFTAAVVSVIAPDSKWRMFFDRLDAEILVHVDKLPRLSGVMRGHTGIRARAKQNDVVSDRAKDTKWSKGLRSGSCVSPFRVNWDGTWICIDKELLYSGGFDPLVVGNEKILVRQTGDRLIAAVDSDGFHHLNNLHSFSVRRVKSPVTVIDTAYIAGLMNSSLWLYLYQLITRERARALAQIDIETVEAMPVELADEQTHARIAAIASSIPAMSDKFRMIAMRAIDRLVYDLYELPDRCIEHVESYCQSFSPRLADAKSDHELPPREELDEIMNNLHPAV